METEEAQEQIAAIIERDTNAASGDAYEAAGGILTEVVKKIAETHTIHKGYAQIIINAIGAEGWLLDPDQVPGRTVTESELRERSHYMTDDERTAFLEGVGAVGGTVVPDPEPTNAEKLEATLLDRLGLLEALGNSGVHALASELDREGVRAPGGVNDEH